MKYLQRYKVPFSGLKNNKHVFDFDIDKRFFDAYSYSLVKDGQVQVKIILEKQENLMIAQFLLKGEIALACDLCLNSYMHTLSQKERIIIKFQGETEINDTTEEILVLSKNDYEIDFAPLIYEFINLAVPINSRCDKPGETEYCDHKVLNKLKALEHQSTTEENTDPRWDILKKIKNN